MEIVNVVMLHIGWFTVGVLFGKFISWIWGRIRELML